MYISEVCHRLTLDTFDIKEAEEYAKEHYPGWEVVEEGYYEVAEGMPDSCIVLEKIGRYEIGTTDEEIEASIRLLGKPLEGVPAGFSVVPTDWLEKLKTADGALALELVEHLQMNGLQSPKEDK